MLLVDRIDLALELMQLVGVRLESGTGLAVIAVDEQFQHGVVEDLGVVLRRILPEPGECGFSSSEISSLEVVLHRSPFRV